MSPPSRKRRPSSSRRPRAGDEYADVRRRQRRHRARLSRRRRTKRMILSVFGGVAVLLAVGAITGGGVVFTRCNLSSLKPAAIEENSFVYAADGSLLG